VAGEKGKGAFGVRLLHPAKSCTPDGKKGEHRQGQGPVKR